MVNKLVLSTALALGVSGASCGKTIEKKINDQIHIAQDGIECDLNEIDSVMAVIVAGVQSIADRYANPATASCNELQDELRGFGIAFVENAADIDFDSDELTTKNDIFINMNRHNREREGDRYKEVTITIVPPSTQEGLPGQSVGFVIPCNYRDLSEDSP